MLGDMVLKNIIYFRNIDILNTNSICSSEYPLLVNLLSECITEALPFDTYNAQGRDDYFFIYVTDGIFSTEMDGTTYNLNKGSVILFPPKYKYHYWGKPPLKYSSIHFTGCFAKKLLDDLGFYTLPCVVESEFSHKIKSLIDKMIEQYLTNAPHLKYSLSCILEQILLTIAIGQIKETGNRTLKKSIKYIHTYYAEKIQIPYLAKLEGLSNSRYITLFTKETGKTPSEYILNLRLNKACELLTTTNMEVNIIGTVVGYKDQYFFSKIFKKHMGISPQGYRNKN